MNKEFESLTSEQIITNVGQYLSCAFEVFKNENIEPITYVEQNNGFIVGTAHSMLENYFSQEEAEAYREVLLTCKDSPLFAASIYATYNNLLLPLFKENFEEIDDEINQFDFLFSSNFFENEKDYVSYMYNDLDSQGLLSKVHELMTTKHSHGETFASIEIEEMENLIDTPFGKFHITF